MICVSYTRAISGNKENMPSIEEQNNLIAAFARQKNVKIEKKYSDRKQSKDASDGFEELKNDAIARKFDCVVFNSLYQFGANIFFGMDMLHNLLIPAGIHFAIVDEDYFSAEHSREEIDEYYASRKRKCVLDFRMTSLKSYTRTRHYEKYGYRYSDTEFKLEIDEEAAAIVRRIYDMADSGTMPNKIANELNGENVPTIYDHLNIAYLQKRHSDNPHWTYGHVLNILRNPLYIGKWERKFAGDVETLECPAIVTNEQFERVQIFLDNRPRYGKKSTGWKENPYSRVICDLDTGLPIQMRNRTTNRKLVFHLSSGDGGRNQPHYHKTIPYDVVDQSIKKQLMREKNQAVNVRRILLTKEGQKYAKGRIEEVIAEERVALNKMIDISEKMTETKLNLQKDESLFWDSQNTIAGLKAQMKDAETDYRRLEEQENRMYKCFSMDNPWIRVQSEYDGRKPVTKNVVKKHIDKVICNCFESVTVVFKGNEWKQDIPAEWLEV